MRKLPFEVSLLVRIGPPSPGDPKTVSGRRLAFVCEGGVGWESRVILTRIHKIDVLGAGV